MWNDRYQFTKYVRNYGHRLKKHAELWVPFWENFGSKGHSKFFLMFFCALKILFTLRNFGYSFHHVCGMMGHIFSDMCEI